MVPLGSKFPDFVSNRATKRPSGGINPPDGRVLRSNWRVTPDYISFNPFTMVEYRVFVPAWPVAPELIWIAL